MTLNFKLTIGITFYQIVLLDVSVLNANLVMQIKETSSSSLLLELSTTNERIKITDNHTITIYIAAEDTLSLKEGNLMYDMLSIETPITGYTENKVAEILSGNIRVDKSITTIP